MSRGERCSRRNAANPPSRATATAADVPVPQPAGTLERTLSSTARPLGGGNASMAASSSGWRATRGALGTMEYRSPKVSTSNTTGSGPTVVRIETSTPGVTAIFKIRPGPPNHVSVHPPLSQIRTGADASITTLHPPSCGPTRHLRAHDNVAVELTHPATDWAPSPPAPCTVWPGSSNGYVARIAIPVRLVGVNSDGRRFPRDSPQRSEWSSATN